VATGLGIGNAAQFNGTSSWVTSRRAISAWQVGTGDFYARDVGKPATSTARYEYFSSYSAASTTYQWELISNYSGGYGMRPNLTYSASVYYRPTSGNPTGPTASAWNYIVLERTGGVYTEWVNSTKKTLTAGTNINIDSNFNGVEALA